MICSTAIDYWALLNSSDPDQVCRGVRQHDANPFSGLDSASFQSFPHKEDSGSHLGIAPANCAVLNIIRQKDMTKISSSIVLLGKFRILLVFARVERVTNFGTPNLIKTYQNYLYTCGLHAFPPELSQHVTAPWVLDCFGFVTVVACQCHPQTFCNVP